MTNLINSKPRFAWDATTGRIFDYLTNKHHEPVGTLHDRNGGVWDLAHLKHLLVNDQHIDSAHAREVDPAVLVEHPRGIAAKDLTHHEVPDADEETVTELDSTNHRDPAESDEARALAAQAQRDAEAVVEAQRVQAASEQAAANAKAAAAPQPGAVGAVERGPLMNNLGNTVGEDAQEFPAEGSRDVSLDD